MAVKLMIGFTRADWLNNYFPVADGYREGAEQDLVTIEIPSAGTLTDEAFCEEVFIATNSPDELDAWTPGHAIREALKVEGWRDSFFRALSVGDTVDIEGRKYACARLGWDRLD